MCQRGQVPRLLEQAPDAILIVNAARKDRAGDAQAEQMNSGYHREESEDKPDRDALCPKRLAAAFIIGINFLPIPVRARWEQGRNSMAAAAMEANFQWRSA